MVGVMDMKEVFRVHRKKTKLEIAKLLYELFTYSGDKKDKELADKYLLDSKKL